MTRPTHEDGIAVAEAIVKEFGVEWHELHWFADSHLQEVYPDLKEVGSSDVSIHLSELGNHEPELLRQEAQRLHDRNEWVQKVAAQTGRTEEETLAALRKLLLPKEES